MQAGIAFPAARLGHCCVCMLSVRKAGQACQDFCKFACSSSHAASTLKEQAHINHMDQLFAHAQLKSCSCLIWIAHRLPYSSLLRLQTQTWRLRWSCQRSTRTR